MPQILGPDGNPFRDDRAPENGFALPHVVQFASMMGGAWRTYLHNRHDEAKRNSDADAAAMMFDVQVQGLIQERQLGTASLKWHLEIDNDRDPQQRAVRDGVTAIVRSIPRFQGMVMDLLWAIWYGRHASQLVWEWKQMALPKIPVGGPAPGMAAPKSDDRALRRVLTVKQHQPVNGDKIGHHHDGTPYILVHSSEATTLERDRNAEIVNATLGRAVMLRGTWRDRFVVHRHYLRLDADFFDAEAADAVHGAGIRSVIYWAWWLKTEWICNVADWCARTGLGVRLWYYNGSNPKSKQEVADAASKQTDKTNILIPRFGDRAVEGVEYVDTASTGAELLLKLWQHIEELVERYIIGQTLSSSTEGSGLGGTGVAGMHAETKAKIIAFDAINLAETLTEDLVKKILFWSYGEFRDLPLRFVFDVDQPEPEKLLNAAKTFIGMGGAVREDDVRQPLGFAEPMDGEKTLGGQPPAMPGQPGAPGQPPGPGGPGAPPGQEPPPGPGGPAAGPGPQGGTPEPEEWQKPGEPWEYRRQGSPKRFAGLTISDMLDRLRRLGPASGDFAGQLAAALDRWPDLRLKISLADLAMIERYRPRRYERDDDEPERYEAKHAPKGGVHVRGKFYPGGEFIPAEVVAEATKAEKHAIEHGEQDPHAERPKSKGHIAFVGSHEYYRGDDARVYKATVGGKVNPKTGKRTGNISSEAAIAAHLRHEQEKKHELETKGQAGNRGGLPAGQPVGDDAGPSPEGALSGAGEGTQGRSGSLPAGDGGGGSGAVRDDDGSGDGADGGEGTGDGAASAGSGGFSGASGNFRYVDRGFATGGAKKRFQDNLAAIKTLKAIRAEGRSTATPEEQQTLSKYVGWGAFPAVFGYGDEWEKERKALRNVLTSEEWDSARRSTLNAHYTDPSIVDAHWQMAERLGFKGGRFLETSAGIGYYLGMMPPQLAGNTWATAVELDPTTGGILSLLYPGANVKVQGFQDFQAPDNFYDLVASNVPFGDYKVHDPRYNKHQANIHDYFFLKSLDLARPGGLVMHITSTGTMDKPDSTVRDELFKKADLVAAIRFPGGAHKEGAGTDVVTDLLILRKRDYGDAPTGPEWASTAEVADPDGGEAITVNKYFAEHPEQILGRLDRSGTMYGGNEKNVTKTDDYEALLAAAIERLPQGILKPSSRPSKAFVDATPAAGDVKDGGFSVKGGKVFVREGGGMVEKPTKAADVARIEGHLGVRDAIRETLNAQIAGKDAAQARVKLNKTYDEFVAKYGPLNSQANKKVFASDPDAPVLLAAEKYDPKTKKAAKADLFVKDTIRAVAKVETASNAAEALGVSLHETGRIDVARMAALTGQSEKHISGALLSQGLAFHDPSEGWKPADQYLSGNVRQKLAMARAAAETDPSYARNVAALEKVQPEDIDHADIEVKLGAGWVPPSDIRDFAASLLKARDRDFEVNYVPATGEWIARYSSEGERHAARTQTAREVWGTARKDFDDLLQAALNNTSLTVYDKDSNGDAVVNKKETDDAQAKAQEIKDAFKDWVWEDDARRERLHRFYNDNFNNIRHIKFNGQHQTFPGMNKDIAVHAHIKDFVWQVVTNGKALAAHEVGTGKTYAMIASAMELRRLGLARKPAIVCLKANIEQITNDVLKLYPGAKVLSTADVFDAASRKKTISQIATGDYDIVLLTHDNLDMLKMKPEVVKGYIQEEIAELEAARAASQEDNPKKNNRVVKALEKAKLRLEAKLKEALDETKKDDAVYFEETGIDQLFVDEAHKYKSLPVYTKQDRLKGVPTSRSDRATAMMMRTRWLMEQNNGRGVVFATGTPVANTMAELYNMQRYLQPEELKERGISSFDAWASVFGDVQTKMEFTVSGEYKPVSRFAKFTNIPELMQLARQVIDVQRADDLKKPDGSPAIVRPKRKDTVIAAPQSEAMAGLMADLQHRAKNLKAGERDNMLVICTDGRKGALDMRLLDPNAEDDPQSKTNLAVKNVLKINKDRPDATQLIFSDIGVNPTPSGFSVYQDVIDKLVEGGIPRAKIADFSKLEGAKKEAAMQAMRDGQIVIGIGSTEKMGTGVNVQNKLAALHNLDVPWLPASVEQRDGRAWRQGNENKNVDIFRYVSEGSLDQTFWQIIGNKTRFIKQIMTGANTVRTVKDEDSEELSPEQLMAAASGDPRVMEKVNLDEDVRNLRAAENRHHREQSRLKVAVSRGQEKIADLKTRAADLQALAAHVGADIEASPDFSAEIDGTVYTDRKEAQEAYAARSTEVEGHYGYEHDIGTIRGMSILKRHGGEIALVLDGKEVKAGDSLASIELALRRLPDRAAAAAADVTKAKDDLATVQASIGKPFAKAAELKTKAERTKLLELELKGDADKKRDDDDDPEAEQRLAAAKRGSPRRYEAKHSPKGGVNVQGTFYPGGEWIPGDVMANASDQEKKAVEGGGKPASTPAAQPTGSPSAANGGNGGKPPAKPGAAQAQGKPEQEDRSPLYGDNGRKTEKDKSNWYGGIIEPMKGLSAEETAIESAAAAKALGQWAQIRQQYLDPQKGNVALNESGQIQSVVINTDEWRDLFDGYTGTNASAVHEPSSYCNKKLLAEMLVEQKGKGNNEFAIYAGGGGSGKGTAIKTFFDEDQFPIRVDQVSDNFEKASSLITAAQKAGYDPQYIFVDRKPADAWGGVVGRALDLRKKGKLARTVPIGIALKANIEARKTAIQMLEERLDVAPNVIDNVHGDGFRRLITDRHEAIGFLKARLHEDEQALEGVKQQAKDDILRRHAAGEIPEDIAHGLFGGRQKFEDHRNDARTRVPGPVSVSAEQPKGTDPQAAADDRRGEHGRSARDTGTRPGNERQATSGLPGVPGQAAAARQVQGGGASESHYVAQALANLRKTSRTASGIVDTSASAGKAAKMADGLTGEQAAEHATRNFEQAIRRVHRELSHMGSVSPENAMALADSVAEQVNAGIVKAGQLHRTDDSHKYPYTRVADLAAAREQFGQELSKRLNDPKADPVETAAWIEWRADLTDHFWADGVGKTTKALAAIPLMKAGLPLPQYGDNKERFANANKQVYDPKQGGESYLGNEWHKWLSYYRTLMPAGAQASK